MRDNDYLKRRLAAIQSRSFSDVPLGSAIEIRFGRKAVKRLGSIREIFDKDRTALIMINRYFADENIPDFLIDATIAHELCHYVQGYASPLPKLSPYPHRGGAVDRELAKRGLGHLVEREKTWLKENWILYITNNV